MRSVISTLLALACIFAFAGCTASDGNVPAGTEAIVYSGGEEILTEPTATEAIMHSGGGEILTGPPKLTIFCGENAVDASPGSDSWEYDNGDGTRSSVIACGAHPLQCRDWLEPIITNEKTTRLEFGCMPDEITVLCWSDANWDNTEAESEAIAVTDGTLELKPGGYIYEVFARWSSYEEFGGTASYVFYAVYEDHSHTLAEEPQTVGDPVTGYCGNMVTTVHLDGKAYTFEGTDSVNLTDIVINLEYDPMKLCDCSPEFTVETESGVKYNVNLSEGYVRCEAGQADLTQEQVKEIQEILDNQT